MAEHESGGQAESADRGQLPTVASPPLSPAEDEQTPGEAPAADPKAAEPPLDKTALVVIAPRADTGAPLKRATLTRRHQRRLLTAAAVVLAAGFGAIVGALTASGWSSPPTRDVAGLEERKAMQQSIAHLGKQVAALKANLEKADKVAHSQIAKISQRLDAVPPSDITGSTSPVRVVAIPMPLPRPAPRIAAADSRPAVVADWTIRDARGGFIYVQGHGDIYQVVPGADLPGLGRVQSVQRQDGRWLVVTSGGVIVSQRDRRFFE